MRELPWRPWLNEEGPEQRRREPKGAERGVNGAVWQGSRDVRAISELDKDRTPTALKRGWLIVAVANPAPRAPQQGKPTRRSHV